MGCVDDKIRFLGRWFQTPFFFSRCLLETASRCSRIKHCKPQLGLLGGDLWSMESYTWHTVDSHNKKDTDGVGTDILRALLSQKTGKLQLIRIKAMSRNSRFAFSILLLFLFWPSVALKCFPTPPRPPYSSTDPLVNALHMSQYKKPSNSHPCRIFLG